jgi:hypothetical protein
MPERVFLPDGTYIDIPDNTSREVKIELQRQIDEDFGTNFAQQYSPTLSSASSPVEQTGGTVLGSAWEGIKSIPRGARQFGLMAAQGWEGIRTPDEDTDREKELRQRMDDLMMEIDPRYRDSNLVNVGMGLGQVAGMIGIGAASSALGAGAVGATAITGAATALMGAGEQSSRIAEFEESTGQDVSAAKEVMAMGMGLGIGLSEVALGPMAKFGRAIGVAKRTGSPLAQVLSDQAENVVERGLVGSVLRQAGEEALQEGAAGFAQSATARALYDDQALVGGGAAALKEALIGGQVGGVVEAGTKLFTRAYGGRQGAQLRRLLGRKYEQKIANGEYSTQDINDLLQDLDEDTELGARNRELRDSVVRRDEDTGEFVLHEDETGLINQNNQKFVEENDRLHDKYLDGEISWETYKEASDQLIERSGNLKRELGILAATYNAQAKGLLDRGPEGGDAGAGGEERDSEGRPLIKPSMAPPPTTNEPQIETLAQPVVTEAKDLVDNVKSVLRRSDEDIEIDARETIQRRINEQRTVQADQRAAIKLKEQEVAEQEAELARRQSLELEVEEELFVRPADTEAGSRVSHPEYGVGEVLQPGEPVMVSVQDENGKTKKQNRLVGRVVKHKQFGEGVVTGVKKGNVEVNFGTIERSQLSSFAREFDQRGRSPRGRSSLDPIRTIKPSSLTDKTTNESLEVELEAQRNAGRLVVQFDNESEPRVVSTLTSGDLTSAEMQDRLETLRADGKREGSIKRANLNLTNLRKKFLEKLGEEQGSGVIENTNVGASRQQSPNKTKAERLDLIEQAQAELETAKQTVENLRSEEQRIQNDLRAGVSKNPLTAVPVQGRARQESSQEIADTVERIKKVRNGPWRGAAIEAEMANIRNGPWRGADVEMELKATLKVLEKQDSRGLIKSQEALDSFVIPEGLRYKDFESATDRTLSTKDPSGLNAKGKKLAENFGVDEAQMLATIKEYRATRDRVESLQKELKVLDDRLNELDPSIKLATDRATLSQQQQELETIQNEELFPELEGVETTLTSIESELADPDSRSDTPLLLLRKQFEQLRKKEDTADLTALEERLATAEQRQALRGLFDLVRTEGGIPALNPRQVKRYVQDILSGGVLVRGTPLLEIESLVGEPIKKRIPRTRGRVDPSKPLTKRQQAEQVHSSAKNSWLYGDTRTPTPIVLDSEQAGRDAAEKVIYHTLGIGSLMEIADGLEDSGAYDKPVPKSWVGPSFGQLGKSEFINFRKQLEEAKYEITTDHIFELLKLKGIPTPFGNLASFEKSPFFRDLVFSTVSDVDTDPADAKWKDLTEGEKQAVLARVLNTPNRLRVDQEGVVSYSVSGIGDPELRDQAQRTLAGSVDEVAVRVESQYQSRIEENYEILENGQLGPKKSKQQKLEQAEGLEEARQRFAKFKTAVEKRLRQMNIKAMPMFTSDIDGVYAQIEDVIANGAYQYETDPETGELVPVMQVRSDGTEVPVYRAGYEGGAVASLRQHGTRILYNISQIEQKYGKDWHTKMDEIVRDLTVHEGSHIHFFRDLLTETERKALETFGKKEGYVPASVNKEAHEKKLTWRQYVKELYPDLTEAALTEETSVRILDALAQGKLAPEKTAGLIGKIKRTQLGIFSAIFQSAAEADVNSVMQVFERIQNVDLMKQREARKAENKGLASLRFTERANPEDLKELRKAVKENNQEQIDIIADRILSARQEFTDNRSPAERLQESLMSELRARRQIEGSPTHAIAPVLNAQAIEAGDIDIESLNAYFRFRDGREPPFVMPTGEADLRAFRIGKSTIALQDGTYDVLDNTEPGGAYRDSGVAPGQAVIEALDRHNEYTDPATGKKIRPKTQKEFEDMMEMRGLDRFNMRFFDQRIPMLRSQIRANKRRAELATELGEYESALKMLSDQVALSAWRWADNAMNFVSMIMSSGPLQYKDGGFNLNEEAYGRESAGRGDIKVKPLNDIEAPLLQIDRGQEMASRYLNALRVQDVKTQVHRAELELRAAETEFELLGDPNADRTKIRDRRRTLEEWQSLYDRANPVAGYLEVDGRRVPYRLIPEKTITDKKGKTIMGYPETIEFFQQGTGQEHELVRQFAEEWADLNAHMIQFAVDTGQMDQARADILKDMAFVPFYRDEGYQNDMSMYTPDNSVVQETNREAANDDPAIRGANLLDKSIQGSVTPISEDLFANLRANISAIVRDGMRGVAEARTMRDEIANDTAVEIIQPTDQEKARLQYLNEQIKKLERKGAKRTTQEEFLLGDLQAEQAPLKQEIDRKQKLFEEQEAALKDRGFSTQIIRVKGVAQEAVIEFNEDGEPVHRGMPMTENGVTKEYRVMDPALSRAMTDIGFSPMEAIEQFFGKTLGMNPKIAKGISKLLVGSSRALRELVTRSPPFMLKNIIRDSMQAQVIYGGFPSIYFKVWKNVFTPGIVQQAEARGLGIAVDQAFDEADGRTSVRANWDSQIPIFGALWNHLGAMSRVSEVATRMAVYDLTMQKTDGNAAEALTQAIEIMNYGRRGSSRMFATIAAMSPFLNGRMQGLSVLVRNHAGALDSPGIFLGQDGKTLPPDVEKRLRRQQALMRGGLITLGTLAYFLMMEDDEEYKNAREDMKNDWWLIPLGKDEDGKQRLGFKIPIPFEVGLLYKVLPEQMLRAMREEEHDFADVGSEGLRQLKNSLFFDMRPQLIRPMLDAMSNRDAFQRDQIVPSWMESSVAANQQYNPYTNMVARLISGKLDNIPLVNKLPLSSPMKLEYMLRQYTGTLGSYVMTLSDRVARQYIMQENVAGTAADFGFSSDTFAQMPMLGDLFYNISKGGGFQEDFYETLTDLDNLVTTMGQIRDKEGHLEAEKFRAQNQGMFRHQDQLRHFDNMMATYRQQRDAVFDRSDISKEQKRAMLHRMWEQRDDMLSDMMRIMAEIRQDRSATERLFGVEP